MLSKEDQERIYKAAKNYDEGWGDGLADFKSGAIYEHPIAFKKGKIEGFNEGIEAVKNLIWKYRFSAPIAEIIEEIEKLKKPI